MFPGSVVIAVAFPKVVSLQPKSASTFYGRHGNNDQSADTHPEDITQKKCHSCNTIECCDAGGAVLKSEGKNSGIQSGNITRTVSWEGCC